MNLVNCYPYLCGLFICAFFVFAVSFIESHQPDSWVSVSAYSKKDSYSEPGGVYLKAFHFWEEEEVIFCDFGFDGTLDEVRLLLRKNDRIKDPNSQDWNIWTERYLQIREQATSGKSRI